MESKTFTVPHIGCTGCTDKIKAELSQLTGVVRVDADVATKMVAVEWQAPASWPSIEQRLIEIDYPPAGTKEL